MKPLVERTSAAEHRHGHGATYDALNTSRLGPARFRRLPASLPLPWAADGRIVLSAVGLLRHAPHGRGGGSLRV